jgi:acyl-coenzyme A synthetase/AMP-(fatty) acid ligase
VLEAGVIGREDQDELIKPHASVVLNAGFTGSDELAGELQNFVRQRIAEYKRPRWIEFVTELPKTATGKTQRFKLREQAR